MEVTLTIEDTDSGIGYVSAVGVDYPDAYEKARQLIPEGCKAIAIRTNKGD